MMKTEEQDHEDEESEMQGMRTVRVKVCQGKNLSPRTAAQAGRHPEAAHPT